MIGDGSSPTAIGRYRPQRVIGRGGMGVVYLAYDPQLDRQVALKVIATRLSEDPDLRRRFLEEGRLAARIDHPHIVPVYEAGEDGGVLYLAMQFIDGSDLRGILLREGPMPAERVTGIVDHVASALDAAHARGLVHRDVKPGNVLIAAGALGDHAYLSDFGLTWQTDAPLDAAASGAMLGTVDYMAPEQVEGGPVGAPTDVYALGCVVYQCITGKPPFLGGEMAVLAAHLGEQPPELRGDARVERISAVIGRALAKRPEDRQTSAGEFASDLREAIGPAAPVAGRTVQHIHAEGGGDRRWWLLAAAVAMALIAAIAGVVWFSSTGSSHSAAGGAVLGSQALGTRRTMLAAAGGGVYVAQITGSNLTGVLESYGPVPGQPLATTPLVSLPFGLAVGDNRAWVLTVSGRRAANAQLLAAPVSNEPPREPGLPLPGRNACVQFPAAECNPVFGAGSVWAASGSKLYRVSPVTLRITKRIAIGSPVTALAFGGGAAWVVSSDGVERIDALTGSVEPVESSLLSPDLRPARVVFVENRLWVLCYASDRAARNVLARIDTGLPEPTVTAIVKYPEASALATSGSDLWVGTSIAPSTVRELDPQTGRTAGDPIALKAAVTGLARSGSRLLAITYDEGTSLRRLVWVGVTH